MPRGRINFMDTKIKTILEKNQLFSNMSEAHMEHILDCSNSRLKSYGAGQIIFSQEEKPNKFYAVISGKVALVKNVALGKKNILFQLQEGSVFGEDFFLDKEEEYWYDAEAITNSLILEFSLKFFSDMCEEGCVCCKQLLRNLLTIITKKEKLFLKKIYINSSTGLFAKISIWLMNNADEKGVLRSGMGREELANYFGVARPSLSRALMKMQEDGLIKVKKDIFYIADFDRVKELGE